MPAEATSEFLAKRYEILTLTLVSSVESGETDATISELFKKREEVLTLIECTPLNFEAKSILTKAIAMDKQLKEFLESQAAFIQQQMLDRNNEQNAIGKYGRTMKGTGSECQRLV